MARSLLPPGFRFHPTDEELLVHYLKKKVSGKIDHDSIIGEIDIYKFEPSDLPGLAILCSRDPEWFFFNAQDKKYHGSRTNRTTRAGYWKATGKDRKVAVGSCTGMKKTLIYYVGRAPHGERTDWVMHEYRLDEELEMKMNSPKSFVLCRVRRKSGLGPRNGEQYGAPVLEEEEEEKEGKTLVNEVCGLPSLLPNSEVERTVQEMPSVATVIEGARMEGGENFESFLQEFLTFEEQEQNPAREVDFLVDGLLDLLDFQSNFTVAESTHATACTNAFDVNTSSLDDFSGLLHPTDSESIMLEDILQMVSGIEGPSEHPSGVQESPLDHSSLHMDDLQRVGYLELADMEVPCDGPSTLESADFERLLNELDSGVEFPPSTSFIQDQLQMQQSLPSDRESVRGLQHLGDTSMNNEFEVPLDSTQGLSVLDNIASRLSMADRVVPSGFALSSDHEGALANSSAPSSALSDPHSNGAYGKPEAQLGEVDNHVESSYPLVDSAALVEYAAVNEQLVHSTLSVALPNDCSNTPVHPAPAPSSPSSFARVISGFLSKVSVLPASAAELPSELKRNQSSHKESGVYSAACSKAGESMLTNPGSLSISGSLLNCTIKLNPLQDEKQIAVTSELELQWAVSPIAIWDRHPRQHCKSSTNCISRYLFWITTVMLIVFCAFRGFCRSTRVALT